MAASKPVEPQSGTGLPRWQLALLVGTPIVLGVGAVYLWNRSRAKERKRTGERKTPEGSASPVQGQDGEARTNRDQENMVGLLQLSQTPVTSLTRMLAMINARARPCLRVSLLHECGQGHGELLELSGRGVSGEGCTGSSGDGLARAS